MWDTVISDLIFSMVFPSNKKPWLEYNLSLQQASPSLFSSVDLSQPVECNLALILKCKENLIKKLKFELKTKIGSREIILSEMYDELHPEQEIFYLSKTSLNLDDIIQSDSSVCLNINYTYSKCFANKVEEEKSVWVMPNKDYLNQLPTNLQRIS